MAGLPHSREQLQAAIFILVGLATCGVALLLLALSGRTLSATFVVAALLASVMIDLDPLPQYLGSDYLAGGTRRLYVHSCDLATGPCVPLALPFSGTAVRLPHALDGAALAVVAAFCLVPVPRGAREARSAGGPAR